MGGPARRVSVYGRGPGGLSAGGGSRTRSSDCCPHRCTGPGRVSGVQPSLSHCARGSPRARGMCRQGRREARAEPPGDGPRPSSPHGGSSCGHLKTGRTGALPSLQTLGGPVQGSLPPSLPGTLASHVRCSPRPAGGPCPAKPRPRPMAASLLRAVATLGQAPAGPPGPRAATEPLVGEALRPG